MEFRIDGSLNIHSDIVLYSLLVDKAKQPSSKKENTFIFKTAPINFSYRLQPWSISKHDIIDISARLVNEAQ